MSKTRESSEGRSQESALDISRSNTLLTCSTFVCTLPAMFSAVPSTDRSRRPAALPTARPVREVRGLLKGAQFESTEYRRLYSEYVRTRSITTVLDLHLLDRYLY
jgi:hypothetical protein